jgi:serralysin
MFGGMLGDTFRFNLGDDADVIGDFQNDLDTIWIDADLMGTMAIEDLGDIATVVGGNLVLDFGGGDTLTLNGVTNVNTLFDDIVLV